VAARTSRVPVRLVDGLTWCSCYVLRVRAHLDMVTGVVVCSTFRALFSINFKQKHASTLTLTSDYLLIFALDVCCLFRTLPSHTFCSTVLAFVRERCYFYSLRFERFLFVWRAGLRCMFTCWLFAFYAAFWFYFYVAHCPSLFIAFATLFRQSLYAIRYSTF